MRTHNKFWLLRLCFNVSLALISLSVLVIIIRTLTHGNPETDVERCQPLEAQFVHDDELIERFRASLRFQTISRKAHEYSRAELSQFIAFIKHSFPHLHSSAKVKAEVVANYSLLFTIEGSQPQLKPVILCAHLDVVPITNENQWEAPPFAGDIRDGFIYGRGSIDNKQSLMGILESMEYLLRMDYTPQRTVILAFGHDEEVSGVEGAATLSQLLELRNIEAEFILDEGLTVTQDVVLGIKKPVALIGISEKGYLTLTLKTNFTGGHSSMPTQESSISILNKAVSRLHSNCQPSMFGLGPEKNTLEDIAPKMEPVFRVVMSNLWLFGPIVNWYSNDYLIMYDNGFVRIMSKKPTTNALIRTTTAVTEFHAGVKSNVLPPSAWATVNHRVHPSQTVQQVIDYDKMLINDNRVDIEVRERFEAAPVSPSDATSFGYQTIKSSISQSFPDAVVAPATMIANTDTRHYWKLSKNIYRFCPTLMKPEDLSRFHGVNERISIDNYRQTVHFYYHILRNADRAELSPVHSHGHEL